MRYPILMSRERYESLHDDDRDLNVYDVKITVNEASVKRERLDEMYHKLLNMRYAYAGEMIHEALHEGDYIDDDSNYYTLWGSLTKRSMEDVECILDSYDAEYTME